MRISDFDPRSGNASNASLNTSDPNFTPTHFHSLWPRVRANLRLNCCLSLFPPLPGIEKSDDWIVMHQRVACLRQNEALEVNGWKRTQGNSIWIIVSETWSWPRVCLYVCGWGQIALELSVLTEFSKPRYFWEISKYCSKSQADKKKYL